MARVRGPGTEQIYAAAQRLVDEGLRKDGSCFSPERAIWTQEAFDGLFAKFVEQPDVTPGVSFEDKLKQQLDGASQAAIQLMAELLFFHLLIGEIVGGKRKRELIEHVLRWTDEPASIPDELATALDHGLVNPGTWYNTRRDTLLSWLIDFGCHWKQLPESERAQLLADPWALKDFALGLEGRSAYIQRAALLHLAFPETFEPIVSREHKRLIVNVFGEHVAEPTEDPDRALLRIRTALTEAHGEGFHFYDQALAARWRPGRGRWDAFVHWARRFYEGEGFDEGERDYKLKAVAALEPAREALLGDSGEWVTALRRGFTNKDNNLTPWQAHDRFLRWVAANPEAGEVALQAIWAPGEVDPSERVRAFLSHVPSTEVSGPGARLAIASFLLMSLEPTQFPVFRPEPFRRAYELTDSTQPPIESDEADRYTHALHFLDTLIDEAASRDLALRDRLDAQALVWAVTKQPPPEQWSEADRRAFRAFRGETAATDQPLDELGDELLVDPDYLQRVVRLLEAKRQVIFYGPPGTGKTYVAQKLAEHLAGAEGAIDLVQFHPSYAYEDFIEGFRPDPNGQGFVLRAGPLKRLAEQARDNPEATHVLVIDEINRGNVAKVFGELYFLLEYRSRDLTLQYSDAPFRMPSNLWVIGTMNTADRSIALVDAALRRRFYFVPFFPDQPPIAGLLTRWLDRHKPELAWVADVVDRANQRLGDREGAIGPSYFLREDLDEEWVELIWTHAVIPYLAEQLYGTEERLADFALDRLRRTATPTETAPTDATPDTD